MKSRGAAGVAGWLRQRLEHGADSEWRRPVIQFAKDAFVRSSNKN
ncbi:hypothetical protein KF707C_28290 [Metapseudomonas furukawaii]|uniref:Uncharacterized protein n=1 Tax=Metapseudomonas furukawaii TaxID=1149133 RepID=A0AAD1FFU8_METFU|nr:hypothetical protein KF707C_28290 [Pseudomonas furukawaii]